MPLPTTTIKFNVGGTVYQVSKSLLEKFLGSLLERCASKTWNEGGEEVFIEGDGTRFRQVLDYMRHGEVTLPRGESTPSFLKEMDYYGIVYDKDKIFNSDDFYLQNLEKVATSMTKAKQKKKLEFLISTIAKDATKMTGNNVFSSGIAACILNYTTKNLTMDDQFACMEEAFVADLLMRGGFNKYTVIKMINDIIASVGLVVTNITGGGHDDVHLTYFVEVESIL